MTQLGLAWGGTRAEVKSRKGRNWSLIYSAYYLQLWRRNLGGTGVEAEHASCLQVRVELRAGVLRHVLGRHQGRNVKVCAWFRAQFGAAI